MDLKEFATCSEEVIDLIKKLLEVDPTIRLNAKQALEHPWFTKMEKGEIGEEKVEEEGVRINHHHHFTIITRERVGTH